MDDDQRAEEAAGGNYLKDLKKDDMKSWEQLEKIYEARERRVYLTAAEKRE